ncbi:Regulatory protein TetR [Rhodococcus sp. AW25M09]|uniref:TetR/AcrR family transcriptional regulator n=1 Tax=Rhodococcus sp. AW25M09 TaxID=1268303 RepID=UPI0002AC17BF|nr:TetR/AcrR family transcriptional regulator [Rhodococcus sp. AW25M09]CCQ14149.1 Regulatory protein TetR [Rhodococcus sp. AW25M09]
MNEKSPGVRADARLNRQRLIDAALAAFTAHDSNWTLEAIAKDAGVGIGTLYRNFSSRESLIEAVYRSELARLCDGAADLLENLPPDVALRAWMGRYADFVSTKRGMAETLATVLASGAITSSDTRQRLGAAVATLLAAGVEKGTLRGDVRAEDVVASLAGVLLASGSTDQRPQANRMLDLLMDGVRRRAGGH